MGGRAPHRQDPPLHPRVFVHRQACLQDHQAQVRGRVGNRLASLFAAREQASCGSTAMPRAQHQLLDTAPPIPTDQNPSLSESHTGVRWTQRATNVRQCVLLMGVCGSARLKPYLWGVRPPCSRSHPPTQPAFPCRHAQEPENDQVPRAVSRAACGWPGAPQT